MQSSWHIVLVVSLVVALGALVGACVARVPALNLECEAAGGSTRFGLWCSQPPPQVSGQPSTPTLDNSLSPSRLASPSSSGVVYK